MLQIVAMTVAAVVERLGWQAKMSKEPTDIWKSNTS